MGTREHAKSSDGVQSPVFSLDRVLCASREAIVEMVEKHLELGAIFQVEDSSRPESVRVCYEIWSSETALRLLNAHGRQIGAYASLAALIDHAETATAW